MVISLSSIPVSELMKRLISAACLSGALLWLAWPPFPTTWVIFFALVPLLWLVDQKEAFDRKWRFRLLVFAAMLTWNVLTTWWVGKASEAGGAFANFANAVLQTIPILLWVPTRKRLGRTLGYIALISYWLSFEYLHLRWEFTWPWLTLGNAFAGAHKWVQWYEWTGVFGGSLWIWLSNIFIYEAFVRRDQVAYKGSRLFLWTQHKAFRYASPLVLVAVPVILSLIRYSQVEDQGKELKVAVLQPNIDPYEEKFDTPVREMVEKMLDLSLTAVDDSTDYLIWPETAIPSPIWLNRAERSPVLRTISRRLGEYPNLTSVIGANTFEEYPSEGESSATARNLINPNLNDTIWYDAFNTALQLEVNEPILWYHKSKLVPGVERMPYPAVFRVLEKLVIPMGGISGSLGIQDTRSVFRNQDDNGAGVAICYESIFGEYCTRYIKNGADVLFIITNDGWWGHTAGHKQHLAYASLRAIENRKSIARSANTGISCFVNQRGDILQATSWDEEVVITGSVYANNKQTFYTRHGDVIGRTSVWVAILLILMGFVRKRTARLM